jgi:hypothetical protein
MTEVGMFQIIFGSGGQALMVGIALLTRVAFVVSLIL